MVIKKTTKISIKKIYKNQDTLWQKNTQEPLV
jgi:hypothetical protein